MKEATGELNMTVITVVAIAAVAAFFYAFLWPTIQQGLDKILVKTHHRVEKGIMISNLNAAMKVKIRMVLNYIVMTIKTNQANLIIVK